MRPIWKLLPWHRCTKFKIGEPIVGAGPLRTEKEDEPELLVVTVSEPPETVAVFVMLVGALDAIFVII